MAMSYDRSGTAQALALSRAVLSVQRAARITDQIREARETAEGQPKAALPPMICDADYCVQPVEIWGEGLLPPCHLCLHYRPSRRQL